MVGNMRISSGDDMRVPEISKDLRAPGAEYELFLKLVPEKLAQTVACCAVPRWFDDDLAMRILRGYIGINPTSADILAEIKRLPFVYDFERRGWQYSRSARDFFTTRLLEQNEKSFRGLSAFIAEALTTQRDVLLSENGWSREDYLIRELDLEIARHTAPTEPEEALELLREIEKRATRARRVADLRVAVEICHDQRRWLPSDHIQVLFLEGMYAYRCEDWNRAESLLRKVWGTGQLDPRVAIAAHLVGVILMRRRQFTKAKEPLEDAERISKQLGDRLTTIHVLNTMGTLYRRQGSLRVAINKLKEGCFVAEAKHYEHPLAVVLNTLGTAYRDQGRLSRAQAALEQSRSIAERIGDPVTAVQVLHTLGTIYRRQGKLTVAKEVLEEAQAIAERLEDSQTSAQVLYSLGTVYSGVMMLSEAEAALEKSCSLNESMGDWHHAGRALDVLYRVYYRQGKLDDAEKALKKLLDWKEGAHDWQELARILHTLGTIYREQGKLGDAELVLEEGLSIARRSGNPYLVDDICESINAVRQEKADEVELKLRCERLGANPQSREARKEYIALLRKLDRIDQALEVAQEGLALDPQDAWTSTAYIGLLIRRYDWVQAEKQVRKHLEVYKSDVEKWVALGTILERIGEPRSAEEIYRYFIGTGKGRRLTKARAWNGLANILRARGEYQEAIRYYHQARQLGVLEHKLQNNLGLVYQAMAEEAFTAGNWAQATKHLSEAEKYYLASAELIKPRSNFVWPFLNLAELYAWREQWQEAEYWLRKVRYEHPTALEIDDIRAKYNDLMSAMPLTEEE